MNWLESLENPLIISLSNILSITSLSMTDNASSSLDSSNSETLSKGSKWSLKSAFSC